MVGIQRRMHLHNTHAVSEVFGILLILTLASTIISVTLFWGAERMTREKETVSSQSAYNQLVAINQVLEDLPHQGDNSSRIVNFVSDKGYVHVTSTGTRFVIFYSINRTFWFDVSNLNQTAKKYNSCIFNISVFNGTIEKIVVTNLHTQLSEEPTKTLLLGPGIPLKYKFNTHMPLTDAVRIDIYNYTNYVLGSGQLDLKGRIWIFDIGHLSYELPTQQAMEKIFLENGAVITKDPSTYFVTQDPPFYMGSNHFIMRAILLQPSSDITAGPGGSYKFIITLKNLSVRENEFTMKTFSIWTLDEYGNWYYKPIDIPSRLTDYNFNIQVFGDKASAWKYYLNSTFTWKPLASEQTLFWIRSDGTLYTKEFFRVSLRELLYTVRVETG